MRLVSQLVRLCRTTLCHMANNFLMQSSQIDAQSFIAVLRVGLFPSFGGSRGVHVWNVAVVLGRHVTKV